MKTKTTDTHRPGTSASPRTARRAIRVIVAAAAVGVLWAHLTELPEVAFAKGTIQPTGALRRVEHIDGGVVDTILVDEGQIVTAGAPLVRLATSDVDTEYANLRVREDVVTRALNRNRQILHAIGFGPNQAATVVGSDIRADAQLKLYESARRRLKDRIASAETRIESAERVLQNVVERQAIEQEDFDRLLHLTEAGLAPAREQTAMAGRQNELEADYLEALLDLQEAERARLDAGNALEELFADTRHTLIGDIDANSEELAMIQRAIIENQMRRERLWVTTSVGGVVQALYLNATGEVVEPGGIVAEILPTEERLVAELRLKPRDIGHVEIGDRVEVRITTFSAKRFGTIEGEVSQISATSTENERQETFFRVRVELTDDLVDSNGEIHAIKAGMEVQASVITGSRSILEFISAPILTPFEGAFGER